jgi:lipopolysaccharide/colanic/teichoic acid biosynthesis glycosyltransferase
MLKFRTMLADGTHRPGVAELRLLVAGAHGGHVVAGRRLYKTVGRDRITRVGAMLRRWSLDELPQLLNVLRGDMSIVGFRPPIADEVELYPSWYHGRFVTKPGLTGLWQVSGRSERTYAEMVRFDLEYATRRSLLLDLAILLRTPWVVVRKRGAV